MGQAEVISLDAVRASKQWVSLRQQLHDYFDLWLDDLQAKLPDPETPLTQITETMWDLRQEGQSYDMPFAPTRPDSARGRRPGQRRQRARRPTWKGQWREVKGFRFYLIDGERIVHLLSWHQIQNETELGEALKQVKEAGLIPEDRVRLCVICDGASWIWEHVESLFSSARQVMSKG